MSKLRALIKNNDEFIGYCVLAILLFCGCFSPAFSWIAVAYIVLFAFLMRKETKIIGLILFVNCFYALFKFEYITLDSEYGQAKTYFLYDMILGILKLFVIMLYLLRIIRKEKKLNLELLIPVVAFLIYVALPVHNCNWHEFIPLALSFGSLYVVFELRNEFNFVRLTRIFVAGIVLSCVFALFKNVSPVLEKAVVSIYTYGKMRFAGLTRHSLHLGAFCMLAIAALLILKDKNKLSHCDFYMMFVPVLIFGYLTLTRAFIITVAVALVVFAVFYLIHYKTKALPFLFSLLAIIGAVVLVFFDYTQVLLNRFVDPYEAANSGNQNGSTWSQGVFDNLFMGSERRELLTLYLKDWSSSIYTIIFGRGISAVIDDYDSHNLFVQILWEHGLIGFVLLVVILVSMINWKKLKGKKQYLVILILLVPYLLFASVELMYYDYIAIVLMIALIDWLDQLSPQGHVQAIKIANADMVNSNAVQTAPNPVDSNLFKDVKLSIIIPVYNGADFIQTCIDRVLQIKLNKEIIVIDDGSTDNSLQLLQTYGNQIVLLNYKENQGVVHARNLGLEHATGDYIAFLDIDDGFELDMHAKILTRMVQAGAGVGMCNYDEVMVDGQVLKSKYSLDYGDLSQDEVIRLHLQDKIIPLIWTSIYSAQLAKRNHFEKIKYGDDILYQLKILLNAKKTCFVNETLYHYLQHPNSTMHQLIVTDDLLERLKIPECLSKKEQEQLKEKFPAEFEYFKLLNIQRCVHAVSTVAVANGQIKESKKLLKGVVTKDICQQIIKNQLTPRSIKFEFWVIKTFGLGFHLFIFPLYKLVRTMLRG